MSGDRVETSGWLTAGYMTRTITALVAALLLVSVAVAPVAAHEGHDSTNSTVDECTNADKGPGGAGGPPGFVADLVPNFISDVIGALPVPNFVKSFFGASTC